MGQQLNSQIEQFLQSLNSADQEGETDQEEPEETIHVYFVREEPEPEEDVIEAIPVQNSGGPSSLFTVATIFFCVGLLLSSITFQLYVMFNPPIVTVTIVPDTKTVTFNGTLQLGRLTHAITLYQTQTVPTTGKGHQDARAATGTITFYNALFSPQIVSAGSVFVGADGIQVQIDTTISVPANNPPQDGIASVTAHAVTPGSHGNIQALDINNVASSSLFVKNLGPFSSGQDARDFQTVAKADISNTAIPLKTTLSSAMTGALQGELESGEILLTLPCMPTVKSDHLPGDEAAKVTVTVAETCNGVAYDDRELRAKATQLLIHQAGRELGTGYSLMGDIQITNVRAVFPTTPVLTFSSKGTWAYGLSGTVQERMRGLIAGKTTEDALHILSSLPGIRSISTTWEKDIKLPKDRHSIHFIIVIPA